MRARIFFITYGAANLGLVGYGVLVLADPTMLVNTFLQRVYALPAGATAALHYLAALFRLLGFFNLVLGSLGLLLLRQYGSGRQKWTVHAVMASSLLAYVGPIVFDNAVGSVGFFEIIELALFISMILAGTLMLAGQKQTSDDGQKTLEANR